MHPKKFEKLITELNPHVEVRRYYLDRGSNDGIYYRGKYICAIPPGYIYPFKFEDYRGMFIAHKSMEELTDALARENIIYERDKLILMRESL